MYFNVCTVAIKLKQLSGVLYFIDEQYTLMEESDTKFVLCDEDTASFVKGLVSRLPWKVQLFSIGNVEGATSLEELLKDDGTGKSRVFVISLFLV